MQFLPDISLRQYSTMRLGGNASYLTEVHDRNDLTEALSWAEQHQLPVIMIGGGSNIVWRDEGCRGLVIVNKIMRYEVFDEDGANYYVTIGAGENWDSAVARMVEADLSGTEALSLIPGLTGATPIQNVGAYGQEIADTLVTVEAYDSVTRSFVNIPGIDCAFGYRTSRFKTTDKGRFYISSVTLHLMRGNPEPPFYASLQNYLTEHQITNFTPHTIRDAVIDIRSHKLPDPSRVANTGSFFENPIVDKATVTQLSSVYENLPSWQMENSDSFKLSAAWLIEQAGFKNFHDSQTGMATWPNNPLVFVNEHAQTTADLMKFKQKVIAAVQAKFGITLEQEPELLP
jgi:UDP-N-acetylmuramate dehydrogenase